MTEAGKVFLSLVEESIKSSVGLGPDRIISLPEVDEHSALQLLAEAISFCDSLVVLMARQNHMSPQEFIGKLRALNL